ncbi:AvrD family protein [Kitasatospora sp. NPDC056138]|uniref:AvrD family protein n=1 Tax=Kitasatospora sp. NPDC056138 TaxID=3345724 RepID=UPI0035E329A1
MTGTTQTPDAPVRETVDDYLGPGERRFFGSGYRRAEQRLTDIQVVSQADGTGTVHARGSVDYPADWSRKGTTDQAPHLSSIDALLIAGEAAELHLTHALGLDAAQRRGLRLRRVQLKAGRRPVEEELDGFAVHATTARPSERSTVVDCRVGELRASLEIEHPPLPAATVGPARSARYDSPEDLLGPARLRPYAAAHRSRTQTIEELSVDLPARRASALLGSRAVEPPAGPVGGLESYSYGAVSALDVFVGAIQLGQILIYGLDSVSRAESNTLWMRQAVLEIGDPYRPLSGPAPLSAELVDPQLLTTKAGETWRVVDIAAAFAHMRIRCSATHRLPADRARRGGTEAAA